MNDDQLIERLRGLAEQVVVPTRAVVPLPSTVDFTASAALTLAGSTAMQSSPSFFSTTVLANSFPEMWALSAMACDV